MWYHTKHKRRASYLNSRCSPLQRHSSNTSRQQQQSVTLWSTKYRDELTARPKKDSQSWLGRVLRAVQYIGCWCAQNTWKKQISTTTTVFASNGKVFIPGLEGYRRTLPASSCPLEHGSTWFLRARHVLADTARHEAGWPWVGFMSRYERLSSHELKENSNSLQVRLYPSRILKMFFF